MECPAFMSQMVAAIGKQPAIIREILGTPQHGNAGLRQVLENDFRIAPRDPRLKLHEVFHHRRPAERQADLPLSALFGERIQRVPWIALSQYGPIQRIDIGVE